VGVCGEGTQRGYMPPTQKQDKRPIEKIEKSVDRLRRVCYNLIIEEVIRVEYTLEQLQLAYENPELALAEETELVN